MAEGLSVCALVPPPCSVRREAEVRQRGPLGVSCVAEAPSPLAAVVLICSVGSLHRHLGKRGSCLRSAWPSLSPAVSRRLWPHRLPRGMCVGTEDMAAREEDGSPVGYAVRNPV